LEDAGGVGEDLDAGSDLGVYQLVFGWKGGRGEENGGRGRGRERERYFSDFRG